MSNRRRATPVHLVEGDGDIFAYAALCGKWADWRYRLATPPAPGRVCPACHAALAARGAVALAQATDARADPERAGAGGGDTMIHRDRENGWRLTVAPEPAQHNRTLAFVLSRDGEDEPAGGWPRVHMGPETARALAGVMQVWADAAIARGVGEEQ